METQIDSKNGVKLNFEPVGTSEDQDTSLELFAPRLAAYIQTTYGLKVSFEALPEDARAIFDGTRIKLNQSISAAQQIFVMLHLTGHAYQLANLPAGQEVDTSVLDLSLNPGNEPKIREYEIEASRYGAGVLVDLGKEELLPWYEGVAASDLEFFITFCKTGMGGVDLEFCTLKPPKLEPLFLNRFEPVKVPELVIV